MPPSTVGAVVLLGWMERESAIKFLLEECVFDPALTAEQATDIWVQHRRRVEALAERRIEAPARLPIPPINRQLVASFLARHRGPEVLDVIKINLMGLVVYQLLVVADKADEHAQRPEDWTAKILVVDRPGARLPIRSEDGTLKINLPHAEHMIALQPDGAFRIQQGAGFVSVAEIEGRLFLKAGYHRSFAFSRGTMNAPDANDRCALVVLTASLPPQLSAAFPDQGLRTTVLGSRPPLFADFFDTDLAMRVRLRKKRWEAHIKIVPVDDH
jgi:hypothetical protein